MASQRFNPQDFLVGLIKFVCGVAIALLVISLAGAATARYFLTQLSSLPERPVYENDAKPKPAADAPKADTAPQPKAEQPAAETEANIASETPDPQGLYQVKITYGSGLLIRSGPGNEYGTIGGIDYDETVDVLEESGERWFKIRFDGVEGWIKGKGNTQRL
ncbi:SH3 domain-containing protein [Leptothoe spongobia]|uniref:SH3 domain-containing protein n=1 Tax=Leptothoe spongobia TAU-MAC 1115 TaxID=1967444 RepID=A0A947GHQ2_9CYAN|nr:SH3 domain-containing protein [Leptothoe spongobia]MBT9314277.1 SH3 domain-containing protein [Leptothoe spongobia TAU-MAC 1115]